MAKYSKTERQLLLYEIIYTSQRIETKDVVKRLEAGQKMIMRDIMDLTDAGLINLKYSRKEKAYLKEIPTGILNETEGTRRYQYLKKLIRLTAFMEELSGASIGNDLEYNCRTRYKELFPEVSERTRMRDYQIMKSIGYVIRWNEYEQRHSVTGYLYEVREKFE